MRLGIGSYTYVWSVGVPGYPSPAVPLTAAGLLDRAADLGVSVVQIADNLPLDRLPESELRSLKAHADRLGLTLEVGTRGLAPGGLRRYLDIAVELNAKVVRTMTDADGHRPTPDEAIELLRAAAPAYERTGVGLAVENHDRFRAAALADIFSRVGSPAVGLCLDTANSIGCVEHVDVLIETCGRWLLNLHVKDYEVFRPPHHKGFVVEGRPAGRGQLDVPGLLTAVRATGRGVNAVVELWPPPEAAAEEDAWVRESVRFLRQYITD